ncbi:MAG: hypothetical protein R3B07_27680 [Polyangiaceae bacterium]
MDPNDARSELEIRVNPRAFGTYSFKVTDPAVFIGKFIGQSGAVDPDVALQWVRDQIPGWVSSPC